ncbi:hypothetical protein DUI87_34438 [Hirundo rustica rustica]|uniref:Uncharacterized protein n=1 Tax=Hirundo rustica rustica TaxID=333673 RepID=A0A3M0J3P3_HIRRU|nr:hypothetical protein DUI87_34438 [Hirundo rustica rustica]
MLADREAKEAAKGEVPDKAVEAALIPDGKVSIEGFRLKIEGCAIRGYDIDFNITQVCTEYRKNETKITPPVPRKAVITKMPAIPEVEEQITPVVTKIGPYAIKKTGVQKLIVNPKGSLTRVEMGVQGVLRHNCGCNQRLPQLSGKVEKEYSLLKFAKLSGIMPLIWRGNFSPAKPVGEGDRDSQPTFRMGPLEDAEAPHNQPRTSAEESCHPGSSSQFSTSLPQLTYQFVAVDVQPPTRTGPWVPEGCGNIVRPGVKGMPLPNGLLYSLYSWLSFANKQHRLTDLRLDLPEFLGTDLTDSTSTHHVFQTMATLLKEIHDWTVQLTSTAEKEQDYLNQLLTLKTDLEQKANELESLKEKMAKTSEEIKSKLDEREENMKNLKKQVENKTKCIEELQQENKVLKKKITAESKKPNLYERKVEKMKLLYDEATMIQRETDTQCQHKITEMVALMEKHKNEYDKMVEEKDAE